ncbi:unnamed protein product [Sphagnum tenellum]
MLGEFEAGSFIVTQDAVDEAPYRYREVIYQGLRRVELEMAKISFDDWGSCAISYRAYPSGERPLARLIDNTLKISLRADNMITINAIVYIEMAIKVDMRLRGWAFGLFSNWCWTYSTICSGDLVRGDQTIIIALFTFGNPDFTKVHLDTELGRLSATITTVNSVVTGFNANQCTNNGYVAEKLQAFFQQKAQEKIKEKFQEEANSFNQKHALPEEFKPYPDVDVFIKYFVTGLIWSAERVIFQANAVYFATIQGTNVSFIPNMTNVNVIPSQGWQPSSPTISQSHLLQGIRLSIEFLNGLMWYGTVSKLTEYHSSSEIWDL